MEAIAKKSLVVEHDRPSQRQYHRLLVPLKARIDGKSFRIDNWSMTGFCVKDPMGSMTPGDVLSVRIAIPFQGFQIQFSARAGVVRTNNSDHVKPSSDSNIIHIDTTQNEAGLEFLNLNERQRSLLQHFSEQLLTGEMSQIDDTICRLDIPVTPPSTDLQQFSGSDAPSSMATEKNSFLAGMGYLVSGLILTLLMGATIYHKLFLIEIESAVISSTIENPQALVEGIVEDIYAKQGDFLQPGSKIMKISSLKLDEEKGLAAIRIKESQLKLAEIKALERAEQQELEVYRKLSKNKFSAAQRHIQALNKQMVVLKRDWQSKNNLAEKGMLSRTERDKAQLRLISVEKELKESQAILVSTQELAEAANNGIYFSDGKRELNIEARQAQIAHALEQVTLEQSKLTLLKRREQSMIVKTVHGGLIAQINKEIGDRAVIHEQLARINRSNNELTIDAYLTQVELTHIHLDSSAEIYIPALDRHYQAKVTSVDRSQHFTSDLNAGMNWANAEERSGRVQLTVLESESIDNKQQLTPGLPAIVRFQRYSFGFGNFNFSLFTENKQPALSALDNNQKSIQ